jgi:hypothetical protein
MTINSAFVRCCRKSRVNGIVHQLFIDFQEAYDSVSEDILYNTFTETGVPIKLRLMKMYLNDTSNEVHIGKNVSDFVFPIQNGLKQGDALSPLLFSSGRSKKIWKVWNCMEHISSWSMLTMLICQAET